MFLLRMGLECLEVAGCCAAVLVGLSHGAVLRTVKFWCYFLLVGTESNSCAKNLVLAHRLQHSVGVSGHCCAAQTRAAGLMGPLANSQHVTAPVSARSPCCFVHGTCYCHCLCFLWTGPWGCACATQSLCSVHLDVIVLALHLEQSVNLQP